MDFMEYQNLARRTQNPELTMHQRLEHALYMLTAECGEIHGIYQKMYQGHAVEPTKVEEECGDLLWAMSELCDCLNVRLECVATKNIFKLQQRYPEGFSKERSINREV